MEEYELNIIILRSIIYNVLECKNMQFTINFFNSDSTNIYGYSFDGFYDNLEFLRKIFDETYLDISVKECVVKKKNWIVLNIQIKESADRNLMISLLRTYNKLDKFFRTF